MENFSNIVQRIVKVSMGIAGVFLLAMMAVVVVNVISRPFGEVVVGTWELVSLLIIVTAVFALGYTTFYQGHIMVRIVIERFSRRIQAIFTIFHSLIGIGIWGIIAWKSSEILFARLLEERTTLLLIPFLPFRIIWLIGLIILCLALLLDISREFKLLREK